MRHLVAMLTCAMLIQLSCAIDIPITVIVLNTPPQVLELGVPDPYPVGVDNLIYVIVADNNTLADILGVQLYRIIGDSWIPIPTYGATVEQIVNGAEWSGRWWGMLRVNPTEMSPIRIGVRAWDEAETVEKIVTVNLETYTSISVVYYPDMIGLGPGEIYRDDLVLNVTCNHMAQAKIRLKDATAVKVSLPDYGLNPISTDWRMLDVISAGSSIHRYRMRVEMPYPMREGQMGFVLEYEVS